MFDPQDSISLPKSTKSGVIYQTHVKGMLLPCLSISLWGARDTLFRIMLIVLELSQIGPVYLVCTYARTYESTSDTCCWRRMQARDKPCPKQYLCHSLPMTPNFVDTMHFGAHRSIVSWTNRKERISVRSFAIERLARGRVWERSI